MKRKIKSMSAFRLDVPPEDEFDSYRDKPGIDYMSSKYDEHGNLLEEIKFDEYGEPVGKSVYTYDEKGQLTGEETYDELNDLEERLSYERDGNGRVVKQFIHYLDETRDTIFYEYNGDGNLTRKILKDEDGEIEREEKIEYSGEFIVGEEIIEEGELVKQSKYTVDDKGNILEAEMMNGEEEFVIVNKYDENGNRVKRLKYDADDNLVEKLEYYYNPDNMIVKTIEENPYKKTTELFGYNKSGNITSQIELNREEHISQIIERDFDEHGNVIEVRVLVTAADQPSKSSMSQYDLALGYSVTDKDFVSAKKYLLHFEYGFFE